jgi:hypothetical protein
MLRNPSPSVIAVVLLAVTLAGFAGVGHSAPGGNGNGPGQGQGGQATTTSSAPTTDSSTSTTSNASSTNGKGQGNADPPPAGCSYSNGWVTATGLPTGVILNFQYTDATGSHGWVLGVTDSGWWSLSVPAPNGPTSYQFLSKTWGPNGSKYTVYASCSA